MVEAGSLAGAFERHARRDCLVDAETGRTISYEETEDVAARLASELDRRGLKAGDRLAVAAPNSLELAALYLGALRAGIVIVPLGAGFNRREHTSMLERTKPGALVTGPGFERAREVGAELSIANWDIDPWQLPPPARLPAEPAGDVLVSIHFTSGTTGAPRGVSHSLGDYLGNAARFAAATGLDESYRFYAGLPMTYMAGYYNLLLLPLSIGAAVVVDRAFDSRSVMSFWEKPIARDVDLIWFVPTILAMLLKVDRDERARAFCSERLRFAAVGTAPLDAGLRQRFEERYGVVAHESYGLSETLLISTSTPSEPASPGGVGRVLEGVELRFDELGRILVDSPDTTLGYLDTHRVEQPFSLPLVDGRWFDTGDIGSIDASGELRITGRVKDVIIRGGVNVSPIELERVLGAHEDVEEIAVVGAPHELLGEDVIAVVRCREGIALDAIEPELRVIAREQLDAAQQPGAYVQIDDFPVTPTGKIRKAALRDIVIDYLGLSKQAKGFTVDVPGPAAAQRWGELEGARLVDLSHRIVEGMTSFRAPYHTAPEVVVTARHETEGRAVRRLTLGTHSGTHVDAPLHFIPAGPALHELPLETFVGPAAVARLTPIEPLTEIGAARLRDALGGSLRHPRLLLELGWSRYWDDPEMFYGQAPYLSTEACTWLLAEGVRLIGMDTPSPDDPRLGRGAAVDSPNHKLLLGRGVVLCEYLTNLETLGSDEVFLIALPLPVEGADGAPARVVAFDPRP